MLFSQRGTPRSKLRALAVTAALALWLSLSGCAMNPATGSPDFVFMSESEEIKIGKEMHAKVLASTPIYQDQELQDYVEEVGQRVAKTSDRPDMDYTFTIIDSPDINAFALPGGYVYINRGLIGYLQSEAQLAAVLGHEIAHITARHAVRRDAAQKGAGLLGFLSVVATGSYVVGDVANLWTSAAVQGYGRDMELEADKFGAEYLYNSQYDPQAMVEVISVLKDQERFSRLKEKDQGKKRQTYHGVFASHPRNDKRLREIIDEAGNLPESADSQEHRMRFRQKTEGLVFGVNYDMTVGDESNEPNRFSHQGLGFTMLFPEGWNVSNQRSQIVGEAGNESAKLTLEVDRLRANIAPSEYIRRSLGIELLRKSEPFTQGGLVGHTGIVDAEPHPKRIAVIYQSNRVYIFTGTVSKPAEDVDYDQLFLDSIHSFRATRVIKTNRESRRIHYVRANDRTTFAALARLSPLGRYAEQELRLLNGYYPAGEPSPGKWIKIVK